MICGAFPLTLSTKGYRGWTLGPRSWQLNLLNKFKFSSFRRLRGDASKWRLQRSNNSAQRAESADER
jgi:hypothetical protein